MKTHEIDIPVTLPEEEKHYCADALLEALTTNDGILGAELDASRSVLTLKYDPERASLVAVEGVAEDLGITLGRQFQACAMGVKGLTCDQCALRLEHGLTAVPGIVHASANPSAGVLGVQYDVDNVTPAEIERKVSDLGYHVRSSEEEEEPLWVKHRDAFLTAAAGICLIGGILTEWLGGPHNLAIAFFVGSYIAGGFYAAQNGIKALFSLALDVDFLMVAAALGAAAIDHWEEGAVLLFLFSLGNTLEHYALGRTRNAIRALMDLSPQQATRITLANGAREEHIVPVEALAVGDMVLVRPGEKIPADGTIVVGQTAVDQAAITGESVPVDKDAGDTVFAGTLNGSGALEVRVAKTAQDTTLAKIVQMVEEARSEKSPTQRFIETFEEKYAWGVVSVTALMIFVPWLLLGQDFSTAFYRAMTLLVVASPCALVISTPASFLSAIANGARNGILFKGGAHLENAAGIKVVAFDKTGTLTYGRPKVTDIVAFDGVAEDEVLRLAAAVEGLSEHPIATAVVNAARDRDLPIPVAKDGKALHGQGILGTVDDAIVWVGKLSLAEEQGAAIGDEALTRLAALESQGKTVVAVGADRPLGLIAVSDTMRPQAVAAIAALKRLGVQKVVMLTGDNRRAAEAIARQAGVDEVHAELLPADKVRIAKQLQEQYGDAAVIGDGVNDAPALAAATVGIAMGAAGSDVALETADVVLMADDLMKLPYAIALGRQATRVVKQNLTFALSVIVVLILSTFLGVIGLPLGVIGHEGSTVIVVLNGLRLLSYKPKLHLPEGSSSAAAPTVVKTA
ncbi:MAG: heavy metal translocating P-type ATPase [Anaerolineae bacterium]